MTGLNQGAAGAAEADDRVDTDVAVAAVADGAPLAPGTLLPVQKKNHPGDCDHLAYLADDARSSPEGGGDYTDSSPQRWTWSHI